MKSEVTFTVSSALLNQELEYVEGPISITINPSTGVIESIERHSKGIDLRGLTLLPLLANLHIHTLDLAIAESGWDLDIDTVVGEPYGLKYLLLKKLSNDSLRDSVIKVIRLSLSGGVGILVEFRELGIRGLSINYKGHKYHFVLAMPSIHDVGHDELRKLISLSDGFGISSPLYFPNEVLKMMFELGRGKYIMAHIAEVKEVREEGDLERLLRIGRPTAIVHGVWLSGDDLRILAEHSIPLILCPRSNKWFLVGTPNYKSIYEEGIVVGLGTDNAGWIKPDLWREGEELLLSLRSAGINDAKWVLKAMTTNAGIILNMDNSICEGCKANMVFLNSSVVNMAMNKYLGIVKRGGPELVHGVMIEGRLRYAGEALRNLRSSLRDSIG